MRRTIIFCVIAQLFLGVLSPTLAFGAEFNPHFIISDTDLTAYDTMSVADVQSFLDANGSAIGKMRFIDEDGIEKTAAEIIVAAAIEERINPRYILVVLQKEQSLIASKNPTQKQLDWATGYGICDACSMNDPSLQKFRGFAIQVRRSAGVMRYYYDNLSQGWIKRAGQSYNISNQTIIPQSNATAFLYTYTPHVQANLNFWKIWNQWFTKVYPDGSLLQAMGDDIVYLIKNGARLPFASKAALVSRYNPETILTVQPGELSSYNLGSSIKLPNYSLVRTPSGMLFLIIDDTKHPIASQAILKKLGYNPDEIEDVTEEDIASYTPGTFITSASLYPLGAILQDKTTKQLYYAKNGIRYVIPSMEVVKVNFPNKKVTIVDAKQLAQLQFDPTKVVSFKDGTLVSVKNSPYIYVVSNGMLRWIPNEGVFKTLGYQTKNIIYTDEQTLIALPTGEPLVDTTGQTRAAGIK